MKKRNKKQIERFKIIEIIAYWEGSINASILCNFIGVIPRNATTEIQAYNEVVPIPLEYNASKKIFVPPNQYKPIYISTEWNLYHEHLVRFAHLYQKGLWHSNSIDVISSDFNHINSEITRTIHECIKNKTSFKAKYHSMNNPRGLTRTFHPHAIAFNGVRWHMRAYSEEHGEFRDFNLSRISKPSNIGDSNVDSLNDHDWHHFITIKLQPHPSLDIYQKKLVLSDYGHINEFKHELRASMVKYFIKFYSISISQNDNPMDKPLSLINKEELQSYLL